MAEQLSVIAEEMGIHPCKTDVNCPLPSELAGSRRALADMSSHEPQDIRNLCDVLVETQALSPAEIIAGKGCPALAFALLLEREVQGGK